MNNLLPLSRTYKQVAAQIHKALKQEGCGGATIARKVTSKGRDSWFGADMFSIYEAIPLHDLGIDRVEIYKIGGVVVGSEGNEPQGLWVVLDQEDEKALVRLPNGTAIRIEDYPYRVESGLSPAMDDEMFERVMKKVLEAELESDLNKYIAGV